MLVASREVTSSLTTQLFPFQKSLSGSHCKNYDVKGYSALLLTNVDRDQAALKRHLTNFLFCFRPAENFDWTIRSLGSVQNSCSVHAELPNHVEFSVVLPSANKRSSTLANPKWRFQQRCRAIEIYVTTPLPYKKLDGYGVQTTQVKFSKRRSLDTIKTPFKSLICLIYFLMVDIMLFRMNRQGISCSICRCLWHREKTANRS